MAMAGGPKSTPPKTAKSSVLAVATPFVFTEFAKKLPRAGEKPRAVAVKAVAAIEAPIAALREVAETLTPVETPASSPATKQAAAEAKQSLEDLALELKDLVQRDRRSRAVPRR